MVSIYRCHSRQPYQSSEPIALNLIFTNAYPVWLAKASPCPLIRVSTGLLAYSGYYIHHPLLDMTRCPQRSSWRTRSAEIQSVCMDDWLERRKQTKASTVLRMQTSECGQASSYARRSDMSHRHRWSCSAARATGKKKRRDKKYLSTSLSTGKKEKREKQPWLPCFFAGKSGFFFFFFLMGLLSARSSTSPLHS